MNIGIIGAGFTGLAAARELLKKGHSVIIFERDAHPGGLAIGYQEKGWDWSVEKHYHHWFTNDHSVLNLAKEIGHPVIITRPKTSVYYDYNISPLDSPQAVLTFSGLPLFPKIRMAAVLGFLRFNPFWKSLESISATDFLIRFMGKRAYHALWEPQLINKFGSFAQNISLAWFWARIKKRTLSLAYPEGGFLRFANSLVQEIKKNNGEVLFGTEVLSIKSGQQPEITYKDQSGKIQKKRFDRLIVTSPSFIFMKLAPSLPAHYQEKLKKLQGIGAINIVLRMKKPFLEDGTYWLSICEINSPIMAVVDHGNFMKKKYYNNEHIVYIGKYLESTHPYFSFTKEELLRTYDPHLLKINPDYKKSLIGFEMFKAPFAQPIIPPLYSKIIPPFDTPLKGVYLANIQQVYPWDRGTNYAVELGQNVAKHITKNET